MYNGPASLHLASGMVVLPGMSNPKAKIMPFAVAVAVDDVGNGAEDIKGAALATPVSPMAVAGTATAALDGPGAASAGAYGKTTVAFGVQDQALLPKQQPKAKPLNPLNPANYF
jgi:hypothetical protein